MTTIIDIDHEGGDLSEYDSYVDDGGDLSVEAGAALAGTDYGLQVATDDTNEIYGRVAMGGTAYDDFRFRFYLERNTYYAGNNNGVCCIYVWGNAQTIIRIWFMRSGGTHYVYMQGQDNVGWWETSADKTAITTEHYIEVHIERESSDSAGDGQITLYVDGSQQQQKTSLQNYEQCGDYDYFDAGARACTGTLEGAFFLDQILANDTGAEIGPHEEPAPEADHLLALLGVGQ